MEGEDILYAKHHGKQGPARERNYFQKVHPVDKANWLSFATFTWISSFMFSSYRNGLKSSEVPHISFLESCNPNTDTLEELWKAELTTGRKPRMDHVIWLAVRKRSLLTSAVYITSIFLGFLSPVHLHFVLSLGSFPWNRFYRLDVLVSLSTDSLHEKSPGMDFEARRAYSRWSLLGFSPNSL